MSWSGHTQASEGNLAAVIETAAGFVAVVARGQVAGALQTHVEDGTLDANTPALQSGSVALIERGAVHSFVRVSDGAFVLLRDEDGEIEVLSHHDVRMYSHEAIERAVLVVGVPREHLDRHRLPRWLERGVRQGELDKLVAAWGDYAVVVIEAWATSTPFPEAADLSDTVNPVGTIPPPALFTESPFGASAIAAAIEEATSGQVTPSAATPTPTAPRPSETTSAVSHRDPRLVALVASFVVVLSMGLLLGVLALALG